MYDFAGNEIVVQSYSGAPHYGRNVFDMESCSRNTGIRCATNQLGLTYSSNNHTLSDFIDRNMMCDGVYKILIASSSDSCFYESTGDVVYYDSNKNPISGVANATSVTLDGEKYYCRIALYYYANSLVDGRLMVVSENAESMYLNKPFQRVYDEFIKYGADAGESAWNFSVGVSEAVDMRDDLNGKTVLGFGDSVMYGLGSMVSGFLRLIADRHDMVFYNHGVSASIWGKSNGILKCIESNISKYTGDKKPDYILLCGQLNDAIQIDYAEHGNTGAETLGEITDFFEESDDNTWDTDTFAGAFEKAIYTLESTFPNAKIIHVLEHKMSPTALSYQESVYNMAKSICEKWNVPTADIWNRLNMRSYNLHRRLYTHSNGRDTGVEIYDEIVQAADEMTDETKVYLYLGNESGWNKNYYYKYSNGSWGACGYVDGTHLNKYGYMKFYVPSIEYAMLYK